MATRRLYGGKDFQSSKDELKARLREKYAPLGITLDFDNDLTSFFTDLGAYTSEALNFFLDLQSLESFISLAQLPSSLDRLANQMGYNPKGAVPASGTLSVGLKKANALTVSMPQGFRFVGTNGLVYQTTQEIIWNPGDTDSRDLVLSQIDQRVLSTSSTGERFLQVPVTALGQNEYLAWRSLTVEVDAVEWEELDLFDDLTTQAYRVSYLPVVPYVEFGDGVVGAVPPQNASLVIAYGITAGSLGNCVSGTITSEETPLIVGGQAVELVIDLSTGIMASGGQPESAQSIRANVPKVSHASGAVITRDDFIGLVNTFRDPLAGAVAAAGAILVTGIENDLTSLGYINTIKGTIVDATTVLNQVDQDIDQYQINSITDLAATQASIQTVVDELGVSGVAGVALQSALDSQDGIIGLTASSSLSVSSAAVVAQQVNTHIASQIVDVASLRALIQGVGSGGTIGAGDFNSMLDLLASIEDTNDFSLAKTSLAGALVNHLNSASSDIASIKSEALSAKAEIEVVQQGNLSRASALVQLIADLAVLSADVSGLDTLQLYLSTNLKDPYDQVIFTANDLLNHLDDIFADACGPNLISVVVLSRAADGYYSAPSIALMRALEGYLHNVTEPSVTFKVVDGSRFLVVPNIEVTVTVEPGGEPLKIKAATIAATTVLMQSLDFGEALNLDKLYDAMGGVDGVSKINVKITGFVASPGSGTVVDTDGNLIVGSNEVATRPTFVHYRRLSNGTKELI